MILALNPFLLVDRGAGPDPAALAALMLAERVVTFMPAPLAGSTRDDVKEAALQSPSFFRYMESLRWSMPLWKEGVITSALDGRPAAASVRRVYDEVTGDARWETLQSLVHEGLYNEGNLYLERVCKDLLRGGIDPTVCVPIAAGLDRFAGEAGIGVVRPESASPLSRHEARAGRRVFSCSMPLSLSTSSEVIMRTRSVLRDEIQEFDAALASDTADPREVTLAAQKLAAAWTARCAQSAGKSVFVGLTGARVVRDVVLSSTGLIAASARGRKGAPRERPEASIKANVGEAPADLLTVSIRVLKAAPA